MSNGAWLRSPSRYPGIIVPNEWTPRAKRNPTPDRGIFCRADKILANDCCNLHVIVVHKTPSPQFRVSKLPPAVQEWNNDQRNETTNTICSNTDRTSGLKWRPKNGACRSSRTWHPVVRGPLPPLQQDSTCFGQTLTFHTVFPRPQNPHISPLLAAILPLRPPSRLGAHPP